MNLSKDGANLRKKDGKSPLCTRKKESETEKIFRNSHTLLILLLPNGSIAISGLQIMKKEIEAESIRLTKEKEPTKSLPMTSRNDLIGSTIKIKKRESDTRVKLYPVSHQNLSADRVQDIS